MTAAVAGPVDVRTAADSATVTDVTKLLSACEPDGTLRWYRGTIRALNDSAGNNRTVSVLPMEQYLRTVIAMEMSPGWADDGGGRGGSLQAQAVAARRLRVGVPVVRVRRGVRHVVPVVLRRRVQVARRRRAPGGVPRHRRHGGGHHGSHRRRRHQYRRRGHLLRVERRLFHARLGPLQPFTALPDAGDATPLNPNHSWSVSLAPSAIAAHYPAIGTFIGITVLTRNGFGEWGGHVLSLRLTGSAGTVTVTGAAFRSAIGLEGHVVQRPRCQLTTGASTRRLWRTGHAKR